MATVLEQCNTEERRSAVLFFLWARGRNAKDIHKEMSDVYGGNCMLGKAVHYWVAGVSLLTKRLKRRYGSC
jgi:hypothetical protein